MVKTQYENTITRIRSDNGPEFKSHYIFYFYYKNGIILETSCTDAPQQKGVVERKHRHILDTARALRFKANLQIKVWGKCVLTAVYIINRLPSKVLKGTTPYEVLMQKSPTYDHMKVFIFLVYV